jgi:hypothetical protein
MQTRLCTITGIDSIFRTLLAGLPALALLTLACGPSTIATNEPDAADEADAADQPDARIDGPMPDGPPPGPTTHLLLSEVTLAPTAGEFVEIYNPGDQPVDLSNYYLADKADYALLPGLSGDGPAPVLSASDFIARFPAGVTIGAGEVKVVAMNGQDFQTQFGVAADYALIAAGGAQAMVDPGSLIGSLPTMTTAGEAVALFYWDGASDLVTDVDLVHAGAPTAANQLTAKGGVMVDGPDADTNPGTYGDDAFTLGVMDAAAGADFSHKRIALEGTAEIQNDQGNGMLGHDETSEQLSQTWDVGGTFTAPTPGQVHPGLQ